MFATTSENYTCVFYFSLGVLCLLVSLSSQLGGMMLAVIGVCLNVWKCKAFTTSFTIKEDKMYSAWHFSPVVALLLSVGQSCFQTQNQSVVSHQQLHPKHQREAIQLGHCACWCWRFASKSEFCPCPRLTFSFPSSRWMETRRAWRPPRWTHGTKAPTLPIVSTSPPCRSVPVRGRKSNQSPV